MKENPALGRRLSWASADTVDPRKQRQVAAAQADEDRKVFENTAKRLELYSLNEANWNIVHSTLGPGLSEFQIQNAVDSGAVRLTPATPSEVQQWRQELAEQRADYLANRASPAELREAARNESEQRHAQAQRQHVQEQVEARERAEANLGLPALPETTSDGQKIDRAYLLRLADTNIKQYKLFCNRYGFAAVTARINGVR
jgi:hypothetical protein